MFKIFFLLIIGAKSAFDHFLSNFLHDFVDDEACLSKRFLFALDLKTLKLNSSGNIHIGKEFHYMAVRIIKVEAKRFVLICRWNIQHISRELG